MVGPVMSGVVAPVSGSTVTMSPSAVPMTSAPLRGQARTAAGTRRCAPT